MLIDLVREVLLIDADEDDSLFFQKAIKDIGAHIRCRLAKDASAGLEATIATPLPDLIFINPNAGLELLSLIKKHPSTKHIPLIMYSSGRNLQLMARAQAHGAAAYIVKPYRLDDIRQELLAVIENL